CLMSSDLPGLLSFFLALVARFSRELLEIVKTGINLQEKRRARKGQRRNRPINHKGETAVTAWIYERTVERFRLFAVYDFSHFSKFRTSRQAISKRKNTHLP